LTHTLREPGDNEPAGSGAADATVRLKPNRDKPVRQGHPWIFSGAIEHIPAAAVDGEIVAVADAGGRGLGRGYLNRRSQIQVRMLTAEDRPIDAAFWRERLAAALALRAALPELAQTDALRLVNAENDGLPGLTVDRFGDYLVLQAGTLAIDRRKAMLAGLLLELTGCRGVVERSEMALRRQEGLGPASGLLAGAAPAGAVEVMESGLRFAVDLLHGQKTGFYTDQRQNRRRFAAHVAQYAQAGATRGSAHGEPPRVLNAFAYTGAFAVYALAAGAGHVTNLDSSVEALEGAETNLRLNGFDPDTAAEGLVGDVFTVLRDWRAAGGPRFDLIVLDPPKFVPSQAQLERGLRGYKDINLLALQLLRPGGLLATFSCSGLVDLPLFQKVVFGAALDAGRPLHVLEWLHQSSDHPVAITFPEGEYLKGLICRAP
jgi:23S rRNA (cytosine1962-C5)-methyltransferase